MTLEGIVPEYLSHVTIITNVIKYVVIVHRSVR